MKISNAFPSDWLKASDLDDGPMLAVISHVAMKDIGGDVKPVLHFQNDNPKPVVLNKTNAHTISEAHGDDTDEWTGKEIVLYASETSFQGKQVPCIRMRKKKVKDAPAGAARIAASKAEMSDDIPF